jgi:hypothetical protein
LAAATALIEGVKREVLARFNLPPALVDEWVADTAGPDVAEKVEAYFRESMGEIEALGRMLEITYATIDAILLLLKGRKPPSIH